MYKKILFLILSLVLIVVYDLFIVWNIGGEYSDIIYDIIYLIAPLASVIFGILAFRNYGLKTTNGKTILFLTIGFFSIFIGEIFWFAWDNFLGKDPFPSIADAFYIASYFFFFIGLIVKIKNTQIEKISPKTGIIASIAGIALALLVAFFSIYLAYDPLATLVENIFSIFYGVGDLILILVLLPVLLVAFQYKKGALFKPWLLVALNFFVMLVADILFAIHTIEYGENMFAYLSIDNLWMLSFLLFANGMFCFSSIIREQQIKILEKLKK